MCVAAVSYRSGGATAMSFPNSFPGSIWIPVPDSDVFSSNSHAAIVIHKTAGFQTAQQVAQYFASVSPGPSVHYVVGLDGTVVQCVSEDAGAGGNCCLETGHDTFWDGLLAQYSNLNLCTLSIEHVDPSTDNSTPVTPEQQAASFALVFYLSQKWGIPPGNIKPHSSLDPISRARCPGNYPFSQLIQFVENGGNMTKGVPNGWHDDGTTLTASNGVPVVLGFREYMLANNWQANDLPLAPEEPANPVEVGWPSSGQGTRIYTMYHELAWTPAKGVYVVSVGREAYYGLHSAANKP